MRPLSDQFLESHKRNRKAKGTLGTLGDKKMVLRYALPPIEKSEEREMVEGEKALLSKIVFPMFHIDFFFLDYD